MAMNSRQGLLCAAVLGVIVCSAWGRQLQQTDANCEAYGALQIEVVANECWARSTVYCDAVSSSKSQYVQAFSNWFGDDYYGNICNSGKAEAAATAVAKVIASVYTSAYEIVKCKHGPSDDHARSNFCGWSHTNADAWAIASATAVAEAIADAGDSDAKGFCLSDVEAVSTVVADVASETLKGGCQNGVTSSYRFDESYQFSIQEGFAKAFAKATASVCKNGKYQASASAKCEGSATSTSKGASGGQGDGFSKGGQVRECTGALQAKCCGGGYTDTACVCLGPGCPKRLYRRTSESPRRTWAAEGDKCFC